MWHFRQTVRPPGCRLSSMSCLKLITRSIYKMSSSVHEDVFIWKTRNKHLRLPPPPQYLLVHPNYNDAHVDVWTRLPIYMSVTFSVYKLMIRCFLQPLMNHVHNKTPLPQKATRRSVCINEPPPAKPIQIDQWLRSGLTRHTHQLVTAEEGVLRGRQWFLWKSMVRWANKNGLSDSCRYCLLD